MYSVNLLSSVQNQKAYNDMLTSEQMPYEVLLKHFYKVLEEFLRIDDVEINKVFNLYVVQLKKNKEDVDRFRRMYVYSFNNFTKADNEVGYLYTYLKKNDREALDFMLKAKKKLLGFYGYPTDRLDIALEKISVQIEDWINLLKSFPFFTNENLLAKIERFKKHISEENENVLEINALEFVKSTYSFYLAEKSQQDIIHKAPEETKLTNFSLNKKRPVSYKMKSENTELTICKTALKYNRGGTNRPLGHSEGYSKLKSPQRAEYGGIQRGKSKETKTTGLLQRN